MSDPLSEEEVAAVRLIIETDKRRVWLMSNIRSIASWIVIVLGGIANLLPPLPYTTSLMSQDCQGVYRLPLDK